MEGFEQSGPSGGAPLAQALDGLWRRFLPEIIARVALLESAVAALGEDGLREEQRTEALAAAHKLAGVLGSFGLARGTHLARELELILTEQAAPGDTAISSAATLASAVAAATELRAVVESRIASAPGSIEK